MSIGFASSVTLTNRSRLPKTFLRSAQGAFRSIAEAFPADYAEAAFDEEDFEKAFDGIDTKVGNFRPFKNMLDTAMKSDKEVVETSYRYYYALQSIYAHGNEAAFVDLSHDSDLNLPVPGTDLLDWTSRRLSEADVISATTSLTSYILHLIEAITGRGAAFVVLGERFKSGRPCNFRQISPRCPTWPNARERARRTT